MKYHLKMMARNGFITLAFFGGVEILSRGLSVGFSDSVPHIFSNLKARNQEMKGSLLNVESEFDRRVFCDFAHKTVLGNQLVARLLSELIPIQSLPGGEIWALGGSTTEETDCPDTVSWTFFLQESILQKSNLNKTEPQKVVNFGKSGANSDYALQVLEKKLTQGHIPGTVLWSNWLNELLIHGDDKDVNFFELRKKYKLKENPRFSQWRILGLRISKTLYEFSYFCRGVMNLTHRISYSVEQMDSEDIINFQSYMGIDMASEILEDQISFFPSAFENNSEKYLSYVLDNIRINLEKLDRLSKQYGFQVVLVYEPRSPRYYKKVYPALNNFLENHYYPQNSQAFYEAVNKYHWKNVDLQKEFAKKRAQMPSGIFSKVDNFF